MWDIFFSYSRGASKVNCLIAKRKNLAMKTIITSLFIFCSMASYAQDDGYHISTIFSNRGHRGSGGYGAISNKFTSINGDFANMVEVYGGWYVGHRFLLGLGGAATTNYIPVPEVHSTNPGKRMSYEYGQCGLMTEYVIASDRAVHLAFQMFAGSGFTLQYLRPDWESDEYWNDYEHDYEYDPNWFFVAEPGVKVEVNLLRWMRFCPGVSYRIAQGSNGRGLSDEKINGTSVNLTLKFGKF
jgi:hypothetical protein